MISDISIEGKYLRNSTVKISFIKFFKELFANDSFNLLHKTVDNIDLDIPFSYRHTASNRYIETKILNYNITSCHEYYQLIKGYILINTLQILKNQKLIFVIDFRYYSDTKKYKCYLNNLNKTDYKFAYKLFFKDNKSKLNSLIHKSINNYIYDLLLRNESN